MQESAEDIDARIVIDHAIEHLDADLRWLTNAAARVGAAASHGKARR
jgi:hypothetical protein